MSLLGIDIGTTGCKAAGFSRDGRSIAVAYREYRKLSLPTGHAEIDSRTVLSNIWDCIAEVGGGTKHDPIEALSISSLGEAMTPVTKERTVIGNSILCSDIRGEEYIQQIKRHISPEEFYEINPNILGPNYSLPKLLWMKEHKPDIYNRAYKFLLWADLVVYMLGGDAVTSYSLANRTLLFDIHKEEWSHRLLEAVGIEEDKLPGLVASGSDAGIISDKMAQALNLPNNVRLIVGGHDQCCNALGAGALEQGKTVCGMGTFECITPVYNSISTQTGLFQDNGLNIEHHIVSDRYVSFLYNQSGSLVKWYRDTFAMADKQLMPEGQDIYYSLFAEMPPGPSNVLVLPHFEMTGPPGFITDSSGVILGLKTSTQRGGILKAILECATFYFVESLDALKNIGIESSEFAATGGGAKSDAWLQIKADILGVPFRRLEQPECGLVGAAMIAGTAINTWGSYEQAASACVHSGAIFDPNEKMHSYYKEKYERYRELYPYMENYLSSYSQIDKQPSVSGFVSQTGF
ncbi:MAG: hypothetical protein K8R35_10125 [Bacteroidales bacterium]|nr:hypothetical protein [Bacteroidales bacterium]